MDVLAFLALLLVWYYVIQATKKGIGQWKERRSRDAQLYPRTKRWHWPFKRRRTADEPKRRISLPSTKKGRVRELQNKEIWNE